MSIDLGFHKQLKVDRITELSYILTDGFDEVFLHKNEATTELNVEDTVDVFVYQDNKKRPTASMHIPYVDEEKAAFLKVVSVNYRLGCFLDIGLAKDLLLSKDDLPFLKKQWPAEGDTIFTKMKISKNQLTAKLVSRFDLTKYLQPKTELIEQEFYDAFVIFLHEEGMLLITNDGHQIFVYQKHLRRVYRLGEKVYVQVTNIKADGSYNGTLIKQKELMLSEDAQIIKKYLEENNGEMPYTDKSSPEVIMHVFHMSKASFKRALGTLYKEKVVQLDKDKTVLI